VRGGAEAPALHTHVHQTAGGGSARAAVLVPATTDPSRSTTSVPAKRVAAGLVGGSGSVPFVLVVLLKHNSDIF
jgi:hypothetical protein